MTIEYAAGTLVWVLYSDNTGDILRVIKRPPTEKEYFKKYKWNIFITTEKSLSKLYKYRVTRTGLEKRVNSYLVVM